MKIKIKMCIQRL